MQPAVTIQTTPGCIILKCTHYKDGLCHYTAPYCKYSRDATVDRLDIAIEALEAISDSYYENGGLTNARKTADDMLDIADSALRRLRLENPH